MGDIFDSIFGQIRPPFINRSETLESFARWHEGLFPDDTGLALFYGVGGIGKSRLVKEIRSRMPEDTPHACIDFEMEELRGISSALWFIRNDLVKYLGERAFPRFDIAFAMYWEKTQCASLSPAQSAGLIERSQILQEIVGEIQEIPGLKGITATWTLVQKCRQWLYEKQLKERDRYLQALCEEDLDASRMQKLLGALFGADLKLSRQRTRRPVIFVEAYEFLGTKDVTREPPGKWLLDIIGFSSGVTWVLTGRDRGIMRKVPHAIKVHDRAVGPLEPHHMRELVSHCGDFDEDVIARIVNISKGVPVVAEAAAQYVQTSNDTLLGDCFCEDEAELIRRFIGHLSAHEASMLTMLTALKRFDRHAADHIQDILSIDGAGQIFSKLRTLTLCRAVSDECLAIEPMVLPLLSKRFEEVCPSYFLPRLTDYLADRSASLPLDEHYPSFHWVVTECLRLARQHDLLPARLEKACELLAASPAIDSAQDALEQLEAGADKDNRGTEAHWLIVRTLAALYRRRGQFREAEQLMMTQEMPPSFCPKWEFILAEIRREMGDPTGADEGYRRVAAHADPGSAIYVSAQIAIADRLMVLGNYRSAIDKLEEIERDGHCQRIDLLRTLRQRGQVMRVAGVAVERTLAIFERAMVMAQSLNARYEEGRLWADMADTLLGAADPRAYVFANNAVEEQEAQGQTVEWSKAATYRAWAAWQQGLASADEELAYADRLAVQAHYLSGQNRLDLLHAARALELGEHQLSAQLAREVIDSLESRGSHRSLNLMARVILNKTGRQTAKEQARLTELLAGIGWLETSDLDADGIPLYLRPLLFPRG